MKSLVIAEKPSVARDIARILHCKKNISGAIEGEKYIVTWALGHLVTLADPEGYDKKFKEWKMDVLPMMPKKMELVVIKKTAKQYNAVKTQLFRKDVDNIIIATDAGREGELVARWILAKANCHKPIKRLWISSVTDKAIQDGFAHLVDGRKYNDLYMAAVSRAEADWLVGINATRALTCKYNAQLSCGRVQTPTLAMIAKREEEIKTFKPQAYYGLTVQAGKIKWTWQDAKSGSYRTFSKERIEELENGVKGGQLQVEQVEKSAKKSFAPGLYDLTELQRDANKRFGFSAKQTLNIMQRLYENHKVLTYPRTDSKYIGTDIVDTIKDRLRACGVGPYKKLAGSLLMKPLQTNKSFVDDKKVSDHHAIIPTEQYVQLEHMTSEERKIYDLVVRRFLSVLYPPFIYEQTTLKGKVGKELFVAKGKTVQQIGWKAVYEYEEEQEEDLAEQSLPQLDKGKGFAVERAAVTEGKTKPPARFTEAALLASMEKGGLGTVATRADIIDKLFNTFFMELKGKEIYLTSKGKQLLSLVPDDLKKPELTADWERKLSRISEGKMAKETFITEIKTYTEDIVDEIKHGEGNFRHENVTTKKCPKCNKPMLAVNGKNARMLVCQDRECGHKEVIARLSNARCPNCHKKMEIIKKGDEEQFVCVCGHKEKMSAFKARREKEGAGVSKKDVQRYLKQQKEEPVNTAFADAFAKLKL
ncbi:MAG: DNA topoisomerase III [Lachnospiraceae bacterium]|nr:DNA topoisomerase III [Lachnospiraceae bacterium]